MALGKKGARDSAEEPNKGSPDFGKAHAIRTRAMVSTKRRPGCRPRSRDLRAQRRAQTQSGGNPNLPSIKWMGERQGNRIRNASQASLRAGMPMCALSRANEVLAWLRSRWHGPLALGIKDPLAKRSRGALPVTQSISPSGLPGRLVVRVALPTSDRAALPRNGVVGNRYREVGFNPKNFCPFRYKARVSRNAASTSVRP
jgi:hypothetical protein